MKNLKLQTEKKYSNFRYTDDGIVLEFSEKPDKQADISFYNHNAGRGIVLPYNLRKIYEETPKIKGINDGAFLLPYALESPMQQNLFPSHADTRIPNKTKTQKVGTMTFQKSKAVFSCDADIPTIVTPIISFYTEKQCYIKIASPLKKEIYWDYATVKRNFAGELQRYPFDTIRYIIPSLSKFMIPTRFAWLTQMAIDGTEVMNVYSDGKSLYIAKKPVKDYKTGKILNPLFDDIKHGYIGTPAN